MTDYKGVDMTESSEPSAVIEAAIMRLETLKAESAPGPWEIEPRGAYFNARFDYDRVMHAPLHPNSEPYDRYLVVDGSYAADAGGLSVPDADLIVTLHRTIDAQLAILRDWIFHAEVSTFTTNESKHVLALARSILGEADRG